MRLVFGARSMSEAKPVPDSYGNQCVLGTVLHDDSLVVLVIDKLENKSYIQKVFNRFAIEVYASENFLKIEDDEEFNEYVDYFIAAGLLPEGYR